MSSASSVLKKRIQWIDALKGFAILLVVFAHVAERYYKFDLVPAATPVFETIYNVVYSFHMPLFFIISGFLFQLSYMTPSWEEKKYRFWKHWINLVVVYTVFSLLLGGVKLVFSDDLLHPVTGLDLVLIWLKPIGHMWYLYVLLVLYLLFMLLRKVPEIALIIGSALLCLSSTFIDISWLNAYHLSRYAFFFCVGMMLFRHRGGLDKSIIVMLIVILSLGLASYAWLHGYSAEKYFGLQLIAGLGISIGIIYLFYKRKFLSTNKFLIWISAYSLEIYILHQYSVAVMTKVLPRVEWLNVFVGYVIGASLTIGIIVASVEVMKKLKIYDIVFKPIALKYE